MKCTLVPFKAGCCDGKTPHHVIPAHCFMPPGAREKNTGERYKGCEKYSVDDAPCICAHGKDKSKKRKQHARIHAVFDKIEDEQPGGTWNYNKASKTGAESVKEVIGCDEKCTQAQLNKYHNSEVEISKGETLRADSSGQSTPSSKLVVKKSTTSTTTMG